MAKITRALQKIFAGSASDIGVFGSGATGAKTLSTDVSTLQGLGAWLTGWATATIGAKKFPPLEEMNALHYIETKQIAYLFQEGVPEYDSTTTYYVGGIVKKAGTYELYGSLVNDNIGNALGGGVSTSNWRYLGDLSYLSSSLSILGSHKNLVGDQVTAATATWTADQVVLQNASGQQYLASNVNQTLNISTSGAGGIDAGAIAASTWYYVWLIFNGITTSIIASLSATAPTMPNGYTYKAKIGSIYSDSSSLIRGFKQVSNATNFVVGKNLSGYPIMASGVLGNPNTGSTVSVSTAPFAPPTAKKITVIVQQNSAQSQIFVVSPNLSAGNAGYLSLTNPFPYQIAGTGGLGAPNIPYTIILESSNIYFATTAKAYLYAIGWEE